MFIGALFLLIGLSIIIKTLFKIDLPVFRILFALFFIYMGVRMLYSDFGFSIKADSYKDKHSAVFTEGDFKVGAGDERGQNFSVVFGNGKLDLTEASGPDAVEVHSVFANMDVYLDPKKISVVRANSVFGEVSMPDGQSVSFGSLQTRAPDQPGEPKLKVHATAYSAEFAFTTKRRLRPSLVFSDFGRFPPSRLCYPSESVRKYAWRCSSKS